MWSTNIELGLDFKRGLGLSQSHKLHSYLIHLGKPNLIGFQVRFEIIKLLLHHLDLFKVLTHILYFGMNFLKINERIKERLFVFKTKGYYIIVIVSILFLIKSV